MVRFNFNSKIVFAYICLNAVSATAAAGVTWRAGSPFSSECILFGPLIGADEPHIITMKLSSLRPSQMEVGKALVAQRAQKLTDEAAEAGETNLAFLAKREAQKKYRVVISPRYEGIVLDGQHGVAVIELILGRDAPFDIGCDVVKDYTKPRPDGSAWTYEAFVNDLLRPVSEGGLGIGRFTREVRGLSPLHRFAYLPSSFGELLDSPLRSLVGVAMKVLKIKSDMLTDYIEFEVGDLLTDLGSLPDLNFNPKNIKKTAQLIISNPKILRFIVDHARSDDLRPEIERQIRAALSEKKSF